MPVTESRGPVSCVPADFLPQLTPATGRENRGSDSQGRSMRDRFQGSILGILQLNVEVPAEAVPGNTAPVTISIGGVDTQPGVTLAIHQ